MCITLLGSLFSSTAPLSDLLKPLTLSLLAPLILDSKSTKLLLSQALSRPAFAVLMQVPLTLISLKLRGPTFTLLVLIVFLLPLLSLLLLVLLRFPLVLLPLLLLLSLLLLLLLLRLLLLRALFM